MRLLKDLPELESKVESGALALSTLSLAQSFFRQEKTSIAEKVKILTSLENKSSREVKKELISRSTDSTTLMKERIKPVSAQHIELKFVVEEELLQEIEELKTLLSHKLPGASLKDLMAFTVKRTLKDLRPKAPKKLTKVQAPGKVVPREEKPAPVVESSPRHSRYIPVEVKRQVWKRNHGQCSFRSNGRRCTAKKAPEFDHIQPFALGGEATEENLRLRCRAHNQLSAINAFGEQKMAKFVSRLS